MISYIGTFLAKRKIEKNIKNNYVGVNSFGIGKISSLVLFYEKTQEVESLQIIKKLQALYAFKQINFVSVILASSKNIEESTLGIDEIRLFKKDLNWLFIPKNRAFILDEIKGKDLYVNICPHSFIPIEFLLSCLQSGIKIGVKDLHLTKNYHLLLQVKENMVDELSWLIERMTK